MLYLALMDGFGKEIYVTDSLWPANQPVIVLHVISKANADI